MRRSRRSAEAAAPRLARLRARLADDGGSASLEFLTVGVLLLVPLVYLVLALGQIQLAVLGVEGASRHAARVVATADSHEAGLAAADRAIRVALSDAGVDAAAAGVVVTCEPRPDACTTPRGTVTVRVEAAAPLPLAPPVLGLETGIAVPVEAQAMQPVSAFGAQP